MYNLLAESLNVPYNTRMELLRVLTWHHFLSGMFDFELVVIK